MGEENLRGIATVHASIDFRRVIEASPNPYMLLDREFRYVWANQAYLNVTRRRLEDLLGLSLFEAFPSGPHDPGGNNEAQLRASLERVFAEGRPNVLAVIRYAIPGPDGRSFDERFWSASHTPILDEHGEVGLVLQQTNDVTELQRLRAAVAAGADRSFQSHMDAIGAGVFRRAQAVQEENRNLETERHHLRELFRQAPGFVAVLRGPDHVFEIANDAYLQLVGRSDILGRPTAEALPEIREQGFIALLDEVLRTGRPYVGQEVRVLLQRRPGVEPEERYVDFVYQPIMGPDGAVSGIFVQGNDVSDRHSSVKALRELNASLEARVAEAVAEREQAQAALMQAQKMDAVGQLTGGVAHDFNNLLQALAGCLNLVGRRVKDPAVEHLLEAGRQAVDRGGKLTQQLMAFARRQALRPEAVDVADALLGMSELLARALRADIALDIDLEPDLWPIKVDPTQLEMAMLNLVVNARDAMPGPGRLGIRARRRVVAQGDEPAGLAGEFVEIAVADTGTGMAPEVLARAFEPFFTTKDVGKGSGLGLAQIYGFARQSGGAVHIESAPGAGTAVTLLLPRSSEAPVRRQAAQPVSGGAGGCILMVEDDPIVGGIMAVALEDRGYTVLRATTADEALALLENGVAADLVFTDVVMPGGTSGLDLARLLRAGRPELPVVLTTGYSEGMGADEGFRILGKPYRTEDLLATIEAALAGRQG
ncbi:PAS domain-containing protein [Arenibaculum pallidiluteum]|uniref:PAS domain-containing protein n=1 Tax=Arenibaculum pallidiluteum TaxID=2812559 RepID=UPI001A97AE38|nr:PAS domain-containing protein [Arenibaculum pallidiluteum]